MFALLDRLTQRPRPKITLIPGILEKLIRQSSITPSNNTVSSISTVDFLAELPPTVTAASSEHYFAYINNLTLALASTTLLRQRILANGDASADTHTHSFVVGKQTPYVRPQTNQRHQPVGRRDILTQDAGRRDL
jgi:hypothetical protein